MSFLVRARARLGRRTLALLVAVATLAATAPAAQAATSPTTGSPIGNLELTTAVPGGVRVKGWAWDPDTTAAVTVVVTAGTVRTTGPANLYRPDVAKVYPKAGSYRGFDLTLPTAAGSQKVCVTATNVGKGSDKSFRCATVTVTGVTPVGNLDGATEDGQGISVRGWAADRDAVSTALTVTIAVDGAVVGSTVASLSRPDVQKVFPDLSGTTGFATVVPASPGTHEVCATALSVGGGADKTFPCRTVTVTTHSPSGELRTVADSADGGLRVTGVATDADIPGATDVRVTVDGAVATAAASPTTSTTLAATTEPGAFDLEVAARPGTYRVCVTAVNVGPGADVELGCADATVVDHAAVGALEQVTTAVGTVSVTGWAADRDATGPVTVTLTVDGVATAVQTGVARPDVQSVDPTLGATTGFSATLPAASGTHEVCAVVENVGPGTDAALGCRSVTVPAPAPAPVPGVPGPTTTGVPAGTTLTVHDGDLRVTTPGTVVANLDIRGYLRIEAADVTVRNTVVRGRPGLTTNTGLVTNTAHYPGLRIIDSELVAADPNPWINGFMGSHATLTRVNIHGVVDSVHITGDDVLIDRSWLHDNLYFATTPWGAETHTDNIQVQVGNNIVVRDSVLRDAKYGGLMVTQDRGPVTNLVFSGNDADNGACTINLAEKTYGPIAATITDNVFGVHQRLDHCAVIAKTTTQDVSTITGNTFTDGLAFKVTRG